MTPWLRFIILFVLFWFCAWMEVKPSHLRHRVSQQGKQLFMSIISGGSPTSIRMVMPRAAQANCGPLSQRRVGITDLFKAKRHEATLQGYSLPFRMLPYYHTKDERCHGPVLSLRRRHWPLGLLHTSIFFLSGSDINEVQWGPSHGQCVKVLTELQWFLNHMGISCRK